MFKSLFILNSEIMLRAVKTHFLKIFQGFWKHNDYLLELFCPVLDSFSKIEQLRSEKYHRRYVSQFLTNFYIMLDTIIVYFTVGYNVKEPYLYQHVLIAFMPEHSRPQLDLILPVAVTLVVIVSADLILDRNSHINYVMFPSERNSAFLQSTIEPEFHPKLSKLLRSFWFKTQNKFQVLKKVIEIELHTAFVFPLIIYEFYRIFYVTGYKTQPRIWFCISLAFKALHEFVVIFMIGFHFIIQNLFINIKQRHLVSTIKKLKSYKKFDIIFQEYLRI